MTMSSIDDSDDPGFEDRRESDRKKLIVELYFDGGDATGIANTTDISLGGLFMKTNAALEVGQPLSVRLTVGGRSFNVDGEIAYEEPGKGFGISFAGLSEEKAALLAEEFDLR